MNRKTVCFLVTLLLMSNANRSWAFNYDEHHDVVCDAVRNICSQLSAVPSNEDIARDYRRDLAIDLLCKTPCEDLAKSPEKKCPSNNKANTRTLFIGDGGARNFGDAVALIDVVPHGDDLREMSCTNITEKAKDIINQGECALLADKHFCPEAPHAYEESHRSAQALALAAASVNDADKMYVFILSALFEEAEALHYFTDNFAAGHQMARLMDSQDPLDTKRVHDVFSEIGRHYVTQADKRLNFGYGDGFLHLSQQQRKTIANAVELSLGDVVFGFVHENFRDSSPLQFVPECPEFEVQNPPLGVEVQVPDSLNHLRGEARLFFSDILQPATHAEVVGAHTLAFAAGGTWPLTSWFNLDADLEIAWWKRGVTLAELNAGVVRNYPGRAIVAAFGMDFVPVRWRILQLVGNVMPIRVSLVDLASSTQGQYRLGHKYDGFDVFLGVGGDIPVSSSQARGLDLRGGLLLGGHRALHSDGIPFYYGSQFSVAYLW